jgi:hypothetical protein
MAFGPTDQLHAREYSAIAKGRLLLKEYSRKTLIFLSLETSTLWWLVMLGRALFIVVKKWKHQKNIFYWTSKVLKLHLTEILQTCFIFLKAFPLFLFLPCPSLRCRMEVLLLSREVGGPPG